MPRPTFGDLQVEEMDIGSHDDAGEAQDDAALAQLRQAVGSMGLPQQAGPQRVSLVTSDGQVMDIEDLSVPPAVKRLLTEVDFQGQGRLSEAGILEATRLVHLLRQSIDVDGSGNVTQEEMLEGVQLLRNLKQQQKGNAGEMDYTYLPSQIQEVMKTWDADGTGKLSVTELASAAKAYEKIQKEGRRMKQIIIALSVIILVMLSGVFVLSFLAAELAKEMRASNGVMKTKSGEVALIGNSDLETGSNLLLPRASAGAGSSRRLLGSDGEPSPLATGLQHTPFGLSSRLSNRQLQELTSFSLELQAGHDARHITVRTWRRKPQPGAHHCGSVVVLGTLDGNFTLDDTDIYYEGTDPEILLRYGASNEEVIATWKDDPDDMAQGRRLAEAGGRAPVRRLSEAAKQGHIKGRRLSAAAMVGMYNSIAASSKGFECVETDASGKEVAVTPPRPPVGPFSFTAEYEHTCLLGKQLNEDVCTSVLPGASGLPRPGVSRHDDGTRTVRSFQSVLEFPDLRVTVAHYPSHVLSRSVEVWDFNTGVKRLYTLVGSVPKGDEKLHCSTAPISEGEKAQKTTGQQVDLAYLGLTTDGGNKEYRRWSVSARGDNKRPGEATSSIEFWEEPDSKAPYRMFMPGGVPIAPNVAVSVFFSPMRIMGFKEQMNNADAAEWLRESLGETLGSGNPRDLLARLVSNCQSVGRVALQTGAEPEKVPEPSGFYGEDVAYWYADRLLEMDQRRVAQILQGPPEVTRYFTWPSSLQTYWRWLMEQRKQLMNTKLLLQATQGSQCAATNTSGSGGRRLQEMRSVILPTFISEALLGEGGMLGFGAGGSCLLAQAEKGARKPVWAEKAGVDITVAATLKYCWKPFNLEGSISITVQKGLCFDLGSFVPRYNMAAAYMSGSFTLAGVAPSVSGCDVRTHGSLSGTIALEALAGIYNDDDSSRSCSCSVCDPGAWGSFPDTTKIRCGCERTPPGGDRRRGYEHDFKDPEPGNSRRRAKFCSMCYQTKPQYDIGAEISADFTVKFDEFTPGFGVDVSGKVNIKARATFLGFDFQQNLVEDLVLFSRNNAFELGGRVCSRRLTPAATPALNGTAGEGEAVAEGLEEEEFVEEEEVAGAWLCADTCRHANDGHCDDGGAGSQFKLCEFGSDCNDCGTRRVVPSLMA